jgi:PST family polysaccharide transporter
MRGILILTLPLSFCLAIAAPELISLLFGETWMPMVPLIRLLLIYASLRPLFDNTGELFTAVGKPKIAGIILMVQAVALIIFCPIFVRFWQADGAALAVGLAMAAGVILAYRQLPQYVTISFAGLFFVPVVSALLGAGLSLGVFEIWPVENDISRLILKSLLFLSGFAATLMVLDGKKIRKEWAQFYRILKGT